MEKKQYAYDIFSILKKLDMQDYTYFQNLTDEELKSIPPYVIMRWLANAPKDDKIKQAARLIVVNRDINVNHWKNSCDKKLQLLTMVDNSGYTYHAYNSRKKNTSNKKADKKYEFLKKHSDKKGIEFDMWYSTAEKDEINMLLDWYNYGTD